MAMAQSPTLTAFLKAVERGDVRTVEQFLDADDVLLLCTHSAHGTALHKAVVDGQAAIVEVLLRQHAAQQLAVKVPDTHMFSGGGPVTALHMAVMRGQLDVVEALLQHHAIKQLDETTNDRDTALHLAAWKGHVQIVQTLLRPEHDPAWQISRTARHGTTALHLAAEHGHPEVAAMLLQHNPAVQHTRQNSFGCTALHLAAGYGRAAVVKVLLQPEHDLSEHALHLPNDDGYTALHLAVAEGHSAAVAALLQRDPKEQLDDVTSNDKEFTALHLAVRKGQVGAARMLLRPEHHPAFQAEAEDYKCRKPLHLAAERGHVSLFKLLLPHTSLDLTNSLEMLLPRVNNCCAWQRICPLLVLHGADPAAVPEWQQRIHQALRDALREDVLECLKEAVMHPVPCGQLRMLVELVERMHWANDVWYPTISPAFRSTPSSASNSDDSKSERSPSWRRHSDSGNSDGSSNACSNSDGSMSGGSPDPSPSPSSNPSHSSSSGPSPGPNPNPRFSPDPRLNPSHHPSPKPCISPGPDIDQFGHTSAPSRSPSPSLGLTPTPCPSPSPNSGPSRSTGAGSTCSHGWDPTMGAEPAVEPVDKLAPAVQQLVQFAQNGNEEQLRRGMVCMPIKSRTAAMRMILDAASPDRLTHSLCQCVVALFLHGAEPPAAAQLFYSCLRQYMQAPQQQQALQDAVVKLANRAGAPRSGAAQFVRTS